MPLDEIDDSLLLEVVEWSLPRKVSTKNGERILREGRPTPEFWQLWRTDKDTIRELGISVGKDDVDEFELTWWQEVTDGDGLALPLKKGQAPGVLEFDGQLPESLPLRSYQIPAVFTLWTAAARHRFALDASETGLGKTYAALATAKLLALNVGIVCPASVVSKWGNTAIDAFDIEPEFVLSYDKLRNGSTDFVSRTEKLRRGKMQAAFVWNAFEPVLLIFDEVHVCAGVGTLNSRLLQAAIANSHVYTLGLSATVANTPLSLSVIGTGLGLHGGNNWWDWCLANGARPGPFGGLTFSARNGTKGEAALQRLHQHIFPQRGCRVRRRDVAGSLARNTIIPELVDVEESQEADVKQALKSLADKEAIDEAKAMEKEVPVSGLTLSLRERQRAEILKVPYVAEKVEDLLAQERSVAVFLNFIASIKLFEGRCKQRHARLVGKLSSAQRDAELTRFQRNQVALIVCQMDAGAASVDLHDVAGTHPRASIISPSWSSTKLLQALGRIDRGQSTDVLQYILFAAEGIEEQVAKRVQAKLNDLSLLNDGDLAGSVQILA
jgi:Mimiviridae putative ATP-dependent RNA helicase